MGIGYRIKEARERLGMTQTELGSLVGVTGSAITNYEKGTSHPKEPIIYRLMETLNVDANYLFQDVMKITKKANSFTIEEIDLIEKYRILDTHGKDMVDTVLDKEYSRSVSAQSDKIATLHQTELAAAHQRTDVEVTDEMRKIDDDIMDDENF